MTDILVIILTKNEHLHIRRCLERLKPLSPRQVFVIDCFSADDTCDIAREMGATVVQHPWPGCQALQFNWTLDNCVIEAAWILRLDADEYLSGEAIDELKSKIDNLPPSVTSISIPRYHIWMGKIMRHGTGAVVLKRCFRKGSGRSEERWMDEHIITNDGDDYVLKHPFYDCNLSGLDHWIQKHLGYSVREAAELLNCEYDGLFSKRDLEGGLGKQAAGKRARKKKYAKFPLFWRSFAYFFYRYFLKGGFLDGKEGFTWNFLQGWWYRTLVDARILEIKRQAKGYVNLPNEAARIEAVLREQYGIH